MSDDQWFDHLVEMTGKVSAERAPARLKSKVYSALVAQMAESGPLLDLAESKKAGGRLCVFESALTMVALGTDIGSMNPCRICHARVMGERLDRAPVFWPGCPYAGFHHD
jgi:hypothetical protein